MGRRCLSTFVVVGLVTVAAAGVTVAVSGVAHAGWYTPYWNHKALFHFDEGSGLATAVASGDSNMTSTTACLGNVASPCPTTTPASAPTWTSDSSGSALSFDGTDDVVSQPHVAALDWTNSSGNTNEDNISIAAWIKPPSPIQSGTILSKGAGGSENYQFGIVASDAVSANLRFSYLDSGLGTVRTITTPLGTGSGARVQAGVWQLVAVRYSRKFDLVEFFINGGRVDQARTPTTKCSMKQGKGLPFCRPTTNTSAVTIGSFGGANFFKGVIDDVFLFIATNPTPNATGFRMGSDGGVVIDRVVFNGGTVPDSVDLYRKDFGDGAAAVNMGGAILMDAYNNRYTVPSVGTRCLSGTTDCYLLSPGGRVTITFDGNPGTGTNLDTAGHWFTSNGASGDTLGGTGLPTPTAEAAALELLTTGLPRDPDSARSLQLTDVVSWGCAGCSGAPIGGNFSTAVIAQGVWPSLTTFVTVGATDSSIHLITAGVNWNGTASWTTAAG